MKKVTRDKKNKNDIFDTVVITGLASSLSLVLSGCAGVDDSSTLNRASDTEGITTFVQFPTDTVAWEPSSPVREPAIASAELLEREEATLVGLESNVKYGNVSSYVFNVAGTAEATPTTMDNHVGYVYIISPTTPVSYTHTNLEQSTLILTPSNNFENDYIDNLHRAEVDINYTEHESFCRISPISGFQECLIYQNAVYIDNSGAVVEFTETGAVVTNIPKEVTLSEEFSLGDSNVTIDVVLETIDPKKSAQWISGKVYHTDLEADEYNADNFVGFDDTNLTYYTAMDNVNEYQYPSTYCSSHNNWQDVVIKSQVEYNAYYTTVAGGDDNVKGGENGVIRIVDEVVNTQQCYEPDVGFVDKNGKQVNEYSFTVDDSTTYVWDGEFADIGQVYFAYDNSLMTTDETATPYTSFNSFLGVNPSQFDTTTSGSIQSFSVGFYSYEDTTTGKVNMNLVVNNDYVGSNLSDIVSFSRSESDLSNPTLNSTLLEINGSIKAGYYVIEEFTKLDDADVTLQFNSNTPYEYEVVKFYLVDDSENASWSVYQSFDSNTQTSIADACVSFKDAGWVGTGNINAHIKAKVDMNLSDSQSVGELVIDFWNVDTGFDCEIG